MQKLLTFLLAVSFVFAWTPSARAYAPQRPPASPASSSLDEDIQPTREQLIRLLRMTPKLTSVVARDPSLLADDQYVAANNPALGQFLHQHPEVVRNPEFYLFANLGGDRPGRDILLAREVWPEFSQQGHEPFLHGTDVLIFLVFLCLLGALLWLIRLFLETRRWNRIFTHQGEAQNKLLDKFAGSQELLTYLESEPGKRLWEPGAAAVTSGFAAFPKSPAMPAIAPFQFGIVFVMLGIGFLRLASQGTADTAPLTIFGVLALMLGIGLILSAVASWVMAKHFGLLPSKAAHTTEGSSNT
ncbi:MAG TPA: hypothetical protein VJS37_20320 [Terriglobales bacterium]|nr:hypothetical protein [Terriglobales bacterium]